MKTRPLYRAIALTLALLASPSFYATAQSPDTMRAGRFDSGKMWTFEYPPAAYFSSTYGFAADDAWFEQARLGALRIPGCSASFVSPNGLMVTNHHCARGSVARVTREGESLLENGFFASSVDEERPIPGYYADQLIGIEDVSDEIIRSTEGVSEEEADAAAKRVAEGVQSRYPDQGNVWVQVVPLYHGGRYSAYVFKRYENIRLVAAPELQLGFFGGDADNFTYPRYALDFAFMRAYDDEGAPIKVDHYFQWSREGVQPGDAVFVIGNPGPTNRLTTMSQIAYQRDVELPAVLGFLRAHHGALLDFYEANPEEARRMNLQNRMFGLSNSLKASTGRLAALRDTIILARRQDQERLFREAVAARPDLQARYGGVFDALAELQERKAAFAPLYTISYNLAHRESSALLRRAIAGTVYTRSKEAGASAEQLAALRAEIEGIGSNPEAIEQRYLSFRIAAMRRHLKAGHPLLQALPGGGTADDVASDLLSRSVYADTDRTLAALEGAGVPTDDPGAKFAEALLPAIMDFQGAFNRLDEEENQLQAQLGRAHYEVYGTAMPPDATFSPRITDGVVKPYPFNGTLAPPYTTFYGLYDLYYTFGDSSEWRLPNRWVPAPEALDLDTPLNFISTADTYGGNSGSPVVNVKLELVGLNFDRNMEGLSRDYIYLPSLGRNIMVDVRAIREALDDVYDADRIVAEIETGRLFRTEAEADQAATTTVR